MRRIALLVAVSLGLVACGGDGRDLTLDGMVDGAPVGESAAGEGSGEGGGAPTLAAWQSAQTELCEGRGERVEARLDDLPEPETMDEVAAYFDAFAAEVTPFIRRVLDVPVPGERRGDVRRYYRSVRVMSELIDRTRAAAHFDDAATLDETMAESEVLGDEMDAALLDLGVPACVDQEVGGTG